MPRETIKACLVLNPVGEAGVTEHAVDGGRRQTRRDATRKRSSKCSLASRGVSRFSVWGDNVLVGRPVPFSRLSFATVLVRAV